MNSVYGWMKGYLSDYYPQINVYDEENGNIGSALGACNQGIPLILDICFEAECQYDGMMPERKILMRKKFSANTELL